MKNIFLNNKDKKECNGCGVCAQKCPLNAIEMKYDEEGFLYPRIDEKLCVQCGKCQNICSNFNNSIVKNNAFMAINKNVEEKMRSSSGGIFYLLSKYVIERNGIVCGVEYGKNLKVQHNYYNNIEDCKKFQGSKYVRSELGNIYVKIEKFLQSGILVLFSGTPCQCNGLKEYLAKEYDNLLVCDVICHANPSQYIFDKYISNLEKKYNKKIIDIKFRDKENGWRNSIPSIVFDDYEKIQEKTFYDGFINGLFVRPSCYDCKFSGLNRISDFSIGDFWGNNIIIPEVKDDNTGISLILVNTDKAKKVFKEIESQMITKKIDIYDAFLFNHNKPLKMNKNRKKFFEKIDKYDLILNIKDCLKVPIIITIIKRMKHIIFITMKHIKKC